MGKLKYDNLVTSQHGFSLLSAILGAALLASASLTTVGMVTRLKQQEQRIIAAADAEGFFRQLQDYFDNETNCFRTLISHKHNPLPPGKLIATLGNNTLFDPNSCRTMVSADDGGGGSCPTLAALAVEGQALSSNRNVRVVSMEWKNQTEDYLGRKFVKDNSGFGAYENLDVVRDNLEIVLERDMGSGTPMKVSRNFEIYLLLRDDGSATKPVIGCSARAYPAFSVCNYLGMDKLVNGRCSAGAAVAQQKAVNQTFTLESTSAVYDSDASGESVLMGSQEFCALTSSDHPSTATQSDCKLAKEPVGWKLDIVHSGTLSDTTKCVATCFNFNGASP